MPDHVFTDSTNRTIALRDHPKLTAAQIRGLVGDAPLMIEVGSHSGEDTVEFLKEMLGIRIHCFEPDERPIKRFKEAIGENPCVTLHQCAVAEIDGTKPFYASTGKAGHMEDWDYSGSLHEPTGHYERSPEIGFKEPELVRCVRLDTWFKLKSTVEIIDFCWCDIQGAQVEFIAGGKMALAVTRFLYIEAHSTPLYDGEPTQQELIAMLPGFEPLGIYEGDNILFRNRHIL